MYIRLEVLLSCFCILIELVVDTKSVSSNSDCKIFLFFDKLTSSGCTFVSGTTVLDSRGLLRVSAGRSVARMWLSDCRWPTSPRYLQMITYSWSIITSVPRGEATMPWPPSEPKNEKDVKQNQAAVVGLPSRECP